MAKKTDNGSNGQEVREVVHPGTEYDADFVKSQNEALTEYKLTGVNPGYVDPTRDQEPDVAPEFGVHPHPELANPAPPAASFSGRALNPNLIPMVQGVEEKAENAKDATERFNEAQQAREELYKAVNRDGARTTPAATPVFLVDAPGSGDSDSSARAVTDASVGDESLALAQTANPAAASSAQLPQDLEAAGVNDGSSTSGVQSDGVDSKSASDTKSSK